MKPHQIYETQNYLQNNMGENIENTHKHTW